MSKFELISKQLKDELDGKKIEPIIPTLPRWDKTKKISWLTVGGK